MAITNLILQREVSFKGSPGMFSMKPDPELILASIGLGVSGEGIIGGSR